MTRADARSADDEAVGRPVRVVVCAVDFSAATTLALDRAAYLARLHGLARLHLVHVAEVVQRDGDDDARALGEWIAAEERAASRAQGLEVVPCFRTGIAAREVSACAASLAADLLVVGDHRPAGMEGASTADLLARDAPCAVVVVRA